MSHTPVGGHPQGWDHKLADRSSLPPASGEERAKSHSKHVFAQPQMPKGSVWREETEGSSGSSARTPSSGDPAPAPYLRWARTLHDLLEDAEGVRLFRKFVASAGGLHLDRLNFYFAVQGLRHETEPAKIRQVVSAIYKFLRKSQLTMPEELRGRVKQGLKDGLNIERTIFDAMEHEVTRTIMETTYQAFLRSEAYVTYVSAATQPLSSPETSSSPPSSGKEMLMGAARDLPTLHEDQELCTGSAGVGAVAGVGVGVAPPARLTKSMLMATQDRRQQQDLVSVFARKNSVYSYPHLAYGGYCPASRQDSERGSMSSGRTDSDVLSMSGSSLDGMSARGGREAREAREAARSHRPRLHGLDRHAVINKDPEVASAMVIPRTLRMQTEQLRTLRPEEFAPLLISKLEKVLEKARRDQETKEKLDRRLMESDCEELPGQAIPPQMVAAAIREKLQVEDDNDQDILDQHVSRVWSERTPGGSPPGGRRVPRPRRRPPSTLSADSGHFDAPSDIGAPHAHQHQLPRRCLVKKAPTELTDSGVSVVSEGTSASGPAVEPRILQWIQEGTERHGRRSYLSSRASSAERTSRRGGGGAGSGAGEPDQMPPLPGPHVPTQLDEARRRLQLTETPRHHARNRPSGGKSSGSSSAAGSGAAGDTGACTVVVVSFLDESVPYRIKVPAAPLTLKLFKDYLPRKGNYRYFFKTECADLDNTVIQEEVCNDHETLPMFEGKVMARVKSVE